MNYSMSLHAKVCVRGFTYILQMFTFLKYSCIKETKCDNLVVLVLFLNILLIEILAFTCAGTNIQKEFTMVVRR